jgi:peptide deformylase
METTVEEARALLPEMWATLEKHPGVGLSAIQIGKPLRLFIMDSRNEHKTKYAFINPEIVKTIGEPVLVEEGCLSVPGVYEKVSRYPQVIIKATNIEKENEPRLFDLYMLESQIALHELEHLDGKMAFVDSYGPVKRDIAKRKVLKYLRNQK